MPLLHLDHGNKNNSKKSNWILWLSYNYFFTNEINLVDKYLDKSIENYLICVLFSDVGRQRRYLGARYMYFFVKSQHS